MRVSRPLLACLIVGLCGCATATGEYARSKQPPRLDPRSLLARQTPAVTAPETTPPPAEISAAAAPAGIDSELWITLTAELARVVALRGPSTGGAEPVVIAAAERQASFTPQGAQNRIADLRLSGSGPYWLTWRYRCQGDYDLNGETNIADLTPIAVGYNRTREDQSWVLHAAADGDGNGAVNISDITPIGMNFGGRLIGYKVYATDELAGEWTYLGAANVDQHLYKNTDRPFFMIYLESLAYEYYALWPYDGSEDEGGWSNITRLEAGQIRKIIGVQSL